MPEPTTLRMVYDSVSEIRRAASNIADAQHSQGRLLEQAIGRMGVIAQRLDAADREAVKLEERMGKLETSVDGMRRVAWVMTIIGGMVIAIATTVASDAVSRMLDPPRPAYAPGQAAQHMES